jgi:SEC-C motif-containing protein
MSCPCCSSIEFEACCGPFISGHAQPDTAEKLMRARYTAHTRADIEYIKITTAPESRKDFDEAETRKWAEGVKWKGLKIQDTKKGGPEDQDGMVEFTATYEVQGQGIDHHEVAQFRKANNGNWLFVDGEAHTHKEGEGHHEKPVTVKRESPKIGRNDPCPCGSGKKYKKCCEGVAQAAPAAKQSGATT